jgi:membrane-associated phospholipid phosphatase
LAFENGRLVIGAERGLHVLVEPALQRLVLESGLLVQILDWTYWLSQFVILLVAAVWIYLRANGAFLRVRNILLVANLLGLAGYLLMPTAPPRMFPAWGFVDTLAGFGFFNQGSEAVQIASNQYAAMPSLHTADALIIGSAMAAIVHRRALKALWALWPGLVIVSVVATGNHYLLDVAAGMACAALAAALVTWSAALAAQRSRQGIGKSNFCRRCAVVVISAAAALAGRTPLRVDRIDG